MKYKVSELKGARLDLAVALAEGAKSWSMSNVSDESSVFARFGDSHPNDSEEEYGTRIERTIALAQYQPSRDWHDGGPIIEREHIRLDWRPHLGWLACSDEDAPMDSLGAEIGPTALIAAMRQFLFGKHGAEVDLPL